MSKACLNLIQSICNGLRQYIFIPTSHSTAISATLTLNIHGIPSAQVGLTGDGLFRPPRGPRSSFTIFYLLNYRAISEETAKGSSRKVRQIAGERWKNLSDTDRKWYQEAAVAERKRYHREIRAHNIPKRPAAARVQFQRSQYAKIRAEHPLWTMREINKVISDRWTNLPSSERDRYKEIEQEESRRYHIQYEQAPDHIREYLYRRGQAKRKRKLDRRRATLISEQAGTVESSPNAHKPLIAHNRFRSLPESQDPAVQKLTNLSWFQLNRRRMKEYQKPINPTSAYMLFYRKFSKNPLNPPADRRNTALIGQKWKQLSQSEKSEYVQQFQKQKAVYLRDLDRWKEDIQAKGHSKELIDTLLGNTRLKESETIRRRQRTAKLRQQRLQNILST